MLIYLIIFALVLFLVLNLFLLFLKIRIDSLESKIKYYFKNRSSSIPSLFEVSKNYLNKHDDIFKEILRLRSIEFCENNIEVSLADLIDIELLIHHELNFIFKVCNKHSSLLKDWKFIYLRDIIIEKSYNVWKSLDIYKLILKKYNYFVRIKNLTILWLFVPINLKTEI